MNIVLNNDKDENKLDFSITGIDFSIANALRRTMIADVPTMSIENVSIYKNNGLLSDEIISHRLGLLPIRVLDNDIKEATFRMDVSFDPEQSDDNGIQTIYSRELITDDPVELVDDDIIIAKIIGRQCLKIEAFAVMGTGFEHSKWSPCCGTTFIKKDDNSFNFKVETTGSLTPHETFRTAINLLKEKLETVQNL